MPSVASYLQERWASCGCMNWFLPFCESFCAERRQSIQLPNGQKSAESGQRRELDPKHVDDGLRGRSSQLTHSKNGNIFHQVMELKRI